MDAPNLGLVRVYTFKLHNTLPSPFVLPCAAIVYFYFRCILG